MIVPPVYIMAASVPFTAILSGLLFRWRREWSNRRIRRFAALPATGILFLVLIANGSFVGSPDDWEGLTHIFAPIVSLILLGLQFLIGLAVSAIIMRQLRPQRGYIE